jgi:hypothetical protein
MNAVIKTIKTYQDCDERELADAGLVRTVAVQDDRFPDDCCRYEKGNEIYIVQELGDSMLRTLEYHNLESGEIHWHLKSDS